MAVEAPATRAPTTMASKSFIGARPRWDEAVPNCQPKRCRKCQRSTVHRRPATVHRLQSTVDRRPATVDRLPSAVCRLPSAVVGGAPTELRCRGARAPRAKLALTGVFFFTGEGGGG